jgi:hypothetical protein
MRMYFVRSCCSQYKGRSRGKVQLRASELHRAVRRASDVDRRARRVRQVLVDEARTGVSNLAVQAWRAAVSATGPGRRVFTWSPGSRSQEHQLDRHRLVHGDKLSLPVAETRT